MYDFHYNFIKRNFDAELLFTDTDSLTYEIKSETVYEEFLNHKHLFDFSNLPKNSNFFDKTNEKVIGKMKDVSGGKINDEFVRLKLKMYSLKNIDGKETNMEKGVSVATEFNEFKDVLFNKELMHKMRRIQSKKHKIGTYEIKKSLYYVLMIKHLFQKIHTRASHKKEEILTDKKDSKRVIMKKRDSKKFSRTERI